MFRKIIYVLAAAFALWLCYVSYGTFEAYNDSRRPDELFVHVDSIQWKTVKIQPLNFSEPVIFQKSDSKPIRVSPIKYGRCLIGIQLDNGQSIWCEFWQSDAGNRKRIDVYITSTNGQFGFRETVNESKDVFNGQTSPENATEQNPFHLDWVG